jgi:hypothetical protein
MAWTIHMLTFLLITIAHFHTIGAMMIQTQLQTVGMSMELLLLALLLQLETILSTSLGQLGKQQSLAQL